MSGAAPVFCALDVADRQAALRLASAIRADIHGLKVGLEFFLAEGAEGTQALAEIGLPIFLDLKLHDIPNTVAGAVRSVLRLKPTFLTLHTSGGEAMMRAAVDAAAQGGASRPKLLGVTVLTSLDVQDLEAVGQAADTKAQVLRLARLARKSGLDGVVCSPEEIASLRNELGPDFVLMVPGIRPAWAVTQDQKRVMTPQEAVKAGATYLVIGRPITAADNPANAARRIRDEMCA